MISWMVNRFASPHWSKNDSLSFASLPISPVESAIGRSTTGDTETNPPDVEHTDEGPPTRGGPRAPLGNRTRDPAASLGSRKVAGDGYAAPEASARLNLRSATSTDSYVTTFSDDLFETPKKTDKRKGNHQRGLQSHFIEKSPGIGRGDTDRIDNSNSMV